VVIVVLLNSALLFGFNLAVNISFCLISSTISEMCLNAKLDSFVIMQVSFLSLFSSESLIIGFGLLYPYNFHNGKATQASKLLPCPRGANICNLGYSCIRFPHSIFLIC